MKFPLRISKRNQKLWEYYLRKKYNRPNMGLHSLIHIAIWEIVHQEAARESDEILSED